MYMYWKFKKTRELTVNILTKIIISYSPLKTILFLIVVLHAKLLLD